jgi:hypothetical protein
METTPNTTLLKSVKSGAIASMFAVGINNIWSLIANALGATIPPGFVLAVTMSSLLPLIIGSVIYFALVRFAPKGYLIWLVLSIGFTLFSFFPVFNTTQLPDGTLLDSTFPLLVGPMHVVSGVLAAWGIPKWSK